MPRSVHKSKDLPDYIQEMIAIIAEVTGISISQLEAMSETDLNFYLSFVIHNHYEKVMQYLHKHNQNMEVDSVSKIKLWKLINKAVISKGNNSRVDKIPIKVIEQILFTSLHKSEQIMLQQFSSVNNSLNNNIKPQIVTEKLLQFANQMRIENKDSVSIIKTTS